MRAGLDARARQRITWHGPFEGSWLERAQLMAMADILEVRLREELREERGGTYGVSVSSDSWQLPEPGYRVTVGFRCDPERVEELQEAVDQVVQQLRDQPLDSGYVEREQAKNRLARETSLEENRFWAGAFAGLLQRGEDPLALLSWDERNDSLDSIIIQGAARRYLDPEQVVRFVLLPAEEE